MNQASKPATQDLLRGATQSGEDLILNISGWQSAFICAALCRKGITARVYEDHICIQNCTLDNPALLAAVQPDLICLDIDGCLMDVSKSFDSVVAKVVANFVDYQVSEADILGYRAMGGYNDDNLLAWAIIKRQGGRVELEDVKRIFREFYFGTPENPGLYNLETPLITSQTFDRLKDRANLALVTGRNREEAALALPILGLPDDFPLYTVDDVPGKPAPDGILAAAKRFDATSVWMVGDNVDDIMAANAAGAIPIGVGPNINALLQCGAAISLPDINLMVELL